MKKDDLQKFCARKNGTRYSIEKPWSRGDYTYATDGYICVRTPRLPEVDEDTKAPDTEKLFHDALALDSYQWVGVPEAKVEKIKCDFCAGSGVWNDDETGSEECEECNGSGELERVEPVRFDFGDKVIGLSNVYLKLIGDLPKAELGLIESAVVEFIAHAQVAPVMFRFDGGDGLLMPMRLYA